ncbi:ATP-dependent helicase HrpB [Corynebacterium halotolerans]|uniref:ATP-dependent helicase n=1 Tax=Corynebacterium halotolerans YIM 70093 = DSM 44683 TaxID=1121362 RepID=M1NNZ7_9CORY|nr:ATP-dependent helicase HrpB [Corynebacterium halotolerans]AGF71227.1 ATP-dependent helicase [Corynebacterium halotolerans YIM 70093 = DSM 44683]
MFDLHRIGRGLPVVETIGELPALLDAASTAVIQAPPGTGKTTLVPPALANHVRGKVLVTAPRRVAVRAAARRLAQLDGSRLGECVGFTVRGEHHPGELVEFVTPGVLLRRLMSDPELTGVSAVAIDEVHERQLDTDLVLGMLLELVQLRDDLRVVAMSATLDAARFAELMGAQVLSTPAVTHPLEITHSPHEGRLGCTRSFLDHLAEQARRAVERTGHSALVFVPGVREVEHVVGKLPGALPLHGSLTAQEQDAALTPSGQPRIVVATSIAESSLTVPGVRVVVDSGLSRVPRRDAARQMTGLVTVSAAKSTVDQRAGRAGREGPGEVIRCYAESEYRHLTAHITPEIATSDLTQAALTLACWGTPRGEGLPLPDAPPAPAIAAAEEVLRGIGAVDQRGEATARGRKLVGLPVDPRLGRALVECGPTAAETVAALADAPRGDVGAQLRILRGQRRFDREVARLRRLAPRGDGTSDPGVITALAFPGKVARLEGGDNQDYLLASGTRAVLPPDSPLRGAEWLAVAEVTRSGGATREGRAGATIRAAARLTEADALRIVGVEETVTATFEGRRLRGRRIRRAGAIELSSTPVQVPPHQAAEALAEGIRREGLGLFRFSEKATALRNRLAFLHERLGEPWPDVDSADPLEFLGPELGAVAHGTPVEKIDLYPALQRLLPWPEATRLDELAPERLAVPSGNRPRVDYSEGRPVVSVKLQECFGLAESPKLSGVPVLFHLLSPAGRPLAVTDDLASFWSGPYGQVRAEMRGRYPKHPWPEDPWSAPATARTRKRM